MKFELVTTCTAEKRKVRPKLGEVEKTKRDDKGGNSGVSKARKGGKQH